MIDLDYTDSLILNALARCMGHANELASRKDWKLPYGSLAYRREMLHHMSGLLMAAYDVDDLFRRPGDIWGMPPAFLLRVANPARYRPSPPGEERGW